VIFPAFLFIVGLSLPFAIRNRMNKGASMPKIALYIFTRSLALLIMGLFHVNLDDYSKASILSKGLWMLLITISFFLVWLDYPEEMPKTKKNMFVGAGIALLILLAIVFRSGDPANPGWMHASWWGILGIIGWAYLVCAIVFLLSKGNFTMLLIAFVAFVALNVCAHTGVFTKRLWVINDGSSASLVMAGTLISSLYTQMAGKKNDSRLWWLLAVCGAGIIALGFLIRPYAGGISKIHSTPAWVFICTGISILAFEFFIWLVDIKGKEKWFSIIAPAGTSTLTCYLMPYFLFAIYRLTNFSYPVFLKEGVGGVIRSFAISFVLIWIVGLMEKRRIRLKV
jgi:predicted acyltransferase